MFDSQYLGPFNPKESTVAPKMSPRSPLKDGRLFKGFLIVRSGSRSRSSPNCTFGQTFMRHICIMFFRALLPFLAEILTKQKCLPMLSIGNPIFKKIQHPDPDPDHHQNRISSSSYRYLPITKIKKLLLQNCGRYRADTQTNKHTDKRDK